MKQNSENPEPVEQAPRPQVHEYTGDVWVLEYEGRPITAQTWEPKIDDGGMYVTSSGYFNARRHTLHKYVRAGAPAAGAQEAREALQAIFDQIECGNLQRNTSRDSEPGWATKQIPLVIALEKMRTALAGTHTEEAKSSQELTLDK